MERLDKLVAGTGRWSRKEAGALIRAGRVTVAGRAVTDPGAKVDEDADIVAAGEPVGGGGTYLMLNKPKGVVTATRDSRERTVLDLLPAEERRRGLFPVGRLDKDTEGLLLLTDDGALAHRLLSPRKHVDKVYRVTVAGTLTQEDQDRLAQGLVLGDGLRCLPAELALTDRTNVGLLTIREGKFHQVKRMMATLGKPVVGLKRLSMGALTLDERLEPGQWRRLTAAEVSSISTKNLEKPIEFAR